MVERMHPREYAGFVKCYIHPHDATSHVVMLDCKRAEAEGNAIVENWKEEGGRYQILCDVHSAVVHVDTQAVGSDLLADPTEFCDKCKMLDGHIFESNCLNDWLCSGKFGVRERTGKKTRWFSEVRLQKVLQVLALIEKLEQDFPEREFFVCEEPST